MEKYSNEIIKILLKEADQKYCQDIILAINENIKEYFAELIHRESTGSSTKILKNISTDKLKENIDDLNRKKKEFEERIRFANNMSAKSDNKITDKEVEQKVKELKQITLIYDEGRQWILDNIKDGDYKKKPSVELKEINIPNIEVFYSLIKDKIYLPLEDTYRNTINEAIHDYGNMILMEGGASINPKLIRLYSEAFDSLSVAVNIVKTFNDDIIKNVAYFSDPIEINNRKKEFEQSLDDFRIKKYGENFTIDHYLKAIQLRDDSKLTKKSIEFIYSIKPKMILRVMNETTDGSIKS